MKMVIPKDILPKEEVYSLRPKDREEYVGNVILEILKKNPRGVTISEVSQQTGFSRDTVSKHLEKWVAVREAYKVIRGNLSIYHSNGKVVHESDMDHSLTGSNKFYTFYRLMNEEGRFIYIQEKEIDDFRAVTVKGGILINEKIFLKFMSELQKFALEEIWNE